MWAPRYWANREWAGRYWCAGADVTPGELLGVAALTQLGSLAGALTLALSGSATTTAVGSVVQASALALSTVTTTCGVGTVLGDHPSFALTGVLGTGSVGIVVPSAVVPPGPPTVFVRRPGLWRVGARGSWRF